MKAWSLNGMRVIVQLLYQKAKTISSELYMDWVHDRGEVVVFWGGQKDN